MSFLISIDIGTTSAKALAISQNGTLLISRQKFYTTYYGQNGEAEQNPDEIFGAILHLLTEIKAETTSLELTALVFSAAMHSVMVVDRSGKPMTPLLIWADTRSATQAADLVKQNLSMPMLDLTGTPIHPMSPLCKITWWRQNRKDLFDATNKFVSIKEYIVHKLTGEFVVDYSIASATGCFDWKKLQWSNDVLKLLGLSENNFSKPAPPSMHLNLSADAAIQTGWKHPVKIILGASDGCCAQLGTQAMSAGDVSITLGTSGAVRVALDRPLLDKKGRLFNYLLSEKVFICGGATNNGTAIVNWFQKNNANTSPDLDAFVDQVADVAPGSDGLMMLPYLLGERAPMYDAHARGAFIGVSITHTARHFQRALLESVCFELKDILQAVEENTGPAKRIMLSGGITRSRAWTQMLSDILQQELTVSDSNDASAVGAAMIGFEALHWQWPTEQRVIEKIIPDKGLAEKYNHLFEIFQSLYGALKKATHDLQSQKS